MSVAANLELYFHHLMFFGLAVTLNGKDSDWLLRWVS
jgi:hypothetical protein